MILHPYHGNMRAITPGRCYKVKYRSKAAARKWVRKHPNQKVIYECPYCGHWHTSTRKDNE